MHFPNEAIKILLQKIDLRLIPERQREVVAKLASSAAADNNINYEDFTAIPILNKNEIFTAPDFYHELVKLHPLKLVLSASDSAHLSFRVSYNEDYGKPIEQFLALSGMNLDKTLVLNAYPFGISFPNTINSVDVGARSHLLNEVLRLLTPVYQHIILLIQPHFLKYYLDLHPHHSLNIHKTVLVLGGHWFSYSFNQYLARSLQVNQDVVDFHLYSSYGSAEVGLGLGLLTPEENLLRRKMAMTEVAPMILKTNPQSYFLESIAGELVVTPLKENSPLKLLRYNLGDLATYDDKGRIYLHERVKNKKVVAIQEFILNDERLHGKVNLKFKIMNNDELFLQVYRGDDDAGKREIKDIFCQAFPEFKDKIQTINIGQDDIWQYNPTMKIRYE